MGRLFTRLTLLVILATGMFSCSKKEDVKPEGPIVFNRPLAAYTYERGEDPFTFVFKNSSSNYKTLEWRFGDDSLSSEVSPTHQYKKPGVYEVNLKATAEDGSTARKLLVISIKADSLAQFIATKTNLNTVKFSITSKVVIKSVLWSFGDGTSSTELSPVKTYSAGFFGDASLQITTDKGSSLTVSKKVTSEGSLSSSLFVSVPGVFSVKHQSNTSAGELFPKVYDGLTNTKFLNTFSATNTIWMQWSPNVPTVSDFYTLTSANDTPTRDPKSWTFQGSLDGVNFVTLNSQTDQVFPTRFQTKLYSFNNSVAYNHYRINILTHGGDTYLQIAEWTMYRSK